MESRNLTIVYVVVCVFLLAIACAAPFSTNVFLAYKPVSDTPSQWFERAGAVTTIFSLLAINLMDDIMNRLVNPRKMAGLESIRIFNAFEKSFEALKAFAFLVGLVGTAIWGYGTVVLTIIGRAA